MHDSQPRIQIDPTQLCFRRHVWKKFVFTSAIDWVFPTVPRWLVSAFSTSGSIWGEVLELGSLSPFPLCAMRPGSDYSEEWRCRSRTKYGRRRVVRESTITVLAFWCHGSSFESLAFCVSWWRWFCRKRSVICLAQGIMMIAKDVLWCYLSRECTMSFVSMIWVPCSESMLSLIWAAKAWWDVSWVVFGMFLCQRTRVGGNEVCLVGGEIWKDGRIPVIMLRVLCCWTISMSYDVVFGKHDVPPSLCTGKLESPAHGS